MIRVRKVKGLYSAYKEVQGSLITRVPGYAQEIDFIKDSLTADGYFYVNILSSRAFFVYALTVFERSI